MSFKDTSLPFSSNESDYDSNSENDFCINYFEPFNDKKSSFIDDINDINDDMDKRLLYQNIKEKSPISTSAQENENKNKPNTFDINIGGQNKDKDMNDLKKNKTLNKNINEETSPTSEKTKFNNNNGVKDLNENNIKSNENTEKNNPNKTNLKMEKNKNDKKSKKMYTNKKRKKKADSNGNNNKLKKVRLMILNAILRFVNKKIKKVFNDNIGKGIVMKQLVNFSRDELTHSSVEFDKKFLKKQLKEIFSGNISGKYTNYLKNKNEDLVKELINLEDNGEYFKAIFQLSFLDCIEHINEIKYIDILYDLETLDEIILNESEGEDLDKDDIDNYKETIKHYKDYIENKNSRRSRKQNVDKGD